MSADTRQLLGAISSGFEIAVHPSLRIPEQHLNLLRRAIARVSSFDRMQPVDVDMGDIIGESPLVVVKPSDRLFWGLPEGEPNRPEKWLCIAGNREPEPTTIVGLQMNYERMGGSDDYPHSGSLVNYSIGPFPRMHPEPQFVNPDYVRGLVAFWRKHAWAASALGDRIIMTRPECPWGVAF